MQKCTWITSTTSIEDGILLCCRVYSFCYISVYPQTQNIAAFCCNERKTDAIRSSVLLEKWQQAVNTPFAVAHVLKLHPDFTLAS